MKSKPKYNMAGNTWFMVRLAWTSREKKVLVLSLLAALFTVAINVVNLYISPAVLALVERHAPVTELLAAILGFVLAMMLLSAASAYVNANIPPGRISVRSELVSLLNKKASTTSYPNWDDDEFRKLLIKSDGCVNGNNGAGEAVWTTLTELTANLLGFLVYVGMLTGISPLLLAVILVTAGISYFIGNYVGGYRYRHREEEAECERHMGYLAGRAGELGVAKDIRIFGLQPWLEELHEKAMDAYTAFQGRAQRAIFWAKIADLLLAFLRNAIAYAYLIGMVLSGGISVSEFLLLFTAVGGFTGWVSGILGNLNTLHRQSLDLATVRECLEYDEPFRFEGGKPLAPEAGRRYEIRLENVSYRYPGADRDTLTNINLTLHPGERLAVVGRNGAGKTTLMKLICGFYDPTEGRVLLDGRDIREFNRADYYTMFSAVFQSFSLLAGTVAANVAQTETDIDLRRVEDCVKKAGLLEKIESLPDGCGTYLNREVYEGAILLSGGETQRLMLARALYKDAPFLVLDEPTAALDPIAESDLYLKYSEMTSGKSSVYISHRMASTQFCDRILLIDDAGIREEGTHAELLRLGGKYAELFEIQSKYYREGVVENGE